MRVIGIAGWSGSGKTTLIANVIPHLISLGVSVSTIKYAHHCFDLDQPGKDSFRHRTAGATEVIVSSAKRWAILHELREEPEWDLGALLAKMSPTDLVLVEGKRDAIPKIEIYRRTNSKRPLHLDDPYIIAVACDSPLPAAKVPVVHHEAKRQVEEELCRTEMEFTILQPARFMHNIVPNLNNIAASGVYTEPFSATAPISDVAYHDVAEVAALALTRSGYSGATFELSADRMLNRHDRAALLSEVLGRPIRAAVQPIDEWLAGARMADPYERSARKLMFEYYDRYGFRGGNGLILRCLLGRSPTSFRSFLQTSGIDPSIHTERLTE